MKTTHETYEKHSQYNSLSTYRRNNDYIVKIEDSEFLYKQAIFTSNRKCIETSFLSLIPAFHESTHTGKDWCSIQQKFGLPHADIGSGFYIPTYITEDAQLVSYTVADECIQAITVTDIITKENVYRIVY